MGLNLNSAGWLSACYTASWASSSVSLQEGQQFRQHHWAVGRALGPPVWEALRHHTGLAASSRCVSQRPSLIHLHLWARESTARISQASFPGGFLEGPAHGRPGSPEARESRRLGSDLLF